MSETTTLEAERQAAYQEAAIELGKGIALGLVPFLGQAIDVYDTIESAIALYSAQTSGRVDDQDNAKFDMVLAVVGWIPGPGDGVKKSLRLVNRNPDRFAPVLFDLLRFVLQECGIRTSPEALLQAVFDVGKLQAKLDDITRAITKSSAFEALPEDAQHAVVRTMQMAQASFPAMVLIVERRIKKWIKVQANSSAHGHAGARAKTAQPGSGHAAGSQGRARPDTAGAGDAIRSQAATVALTQLTNEMVGVSGEHIADYICVERFGWGNWTRHDAGSEGRFEVRPGRDQPGKLSKGGSPKSTHKLYKLADGANGTGIDAVWRAEGHNGGKRYAIVEAKASRNEDGPKFKRKPGAPARALGVVAKGEIPITDLVQVIEPMEEDKVSNVEQTSRTSSRAGRQKKDRGSRTSAGGSPRANSGQLSEALVQMSHEWIEANIGKSVDPLIAREIRSSGDSVYSRHIFYAPKYHPSGSPATHFLAKQQGLAATEHVSHDAFHYDDRRVKDAVNKRKASLRKRYGNLPSLKDEE